ncbi:histidine--tRNA ligase [Arenimonas sp.]|uniref:histidine--tRNA ligase n=1 Tax=Arenimonas sp. TaxID=1872635 RepID=UPI0037C197DE
MIKPRTPAGTLELLPSEQRTFNHMLEVIRRNYERFGFLPIETPVFELSDVLLTKTGGETERQVYFVQSTGALEQGGAPELALRFDLTVPLARYVAEHEHQLAFPFRRYQIQRVYRGERAQKGRFREFYQCDIDVVGKDALSVRYDAEIPAVIHAVFSELAIGPFTISLNNRKILRGFFEAIGIGDGDGQAAVLREIDKIDKRGAEAVAQTLKGEGFGLAHAIIEQILGFVLMRSSSHASALAILSDIGTRYPQTAEGVAEMSMVLTMLKDLGVPEKNYALNFSIARGLDYYTGTVYETTLDDYPQIGSICSGGRYDNLASHYSKSKLPGVGISIGASRLFWQLRESGLMAPDPHSHMVLIGLMSDDDLPESLAIAGELRAAGIACEVQLEAKKLAKQFQYADKVGFSYMLLLGESERAKGVVSLKNLATGKQVEIARADLLRCLSQAKEWGL